MTHDEAKAEAAKRNEAAFKVIQAACRQCVEAGLPIETDAMPAGLLFSLTDRIAAALVAARPQWRDIASAPKDGETFVLVRYADGAVFKACWRCVDFDEMRGSSCYDWEPIGKVFSEHMEPPTHWMELPPVEALLPDPEPNK
jgi:hypothetical protein